MPLSESLINGKIAVLKTKKKTMQRNQVSAGMDHKNDHSVDQAAGIAVTVGADQLATSNFGDYSTYGIAAKGDHFMLWSDVMVRKRFVWTFVHRLNQ